MRPSLDGAFVRRAGWRVVRSPLVGRPARAASHAIAAAPQWSPLRVLAPVRSRLKGEMTADRLLAVADALARAGVPHWVAGGWGIDALRGRQSRRHDDLDVVVGDFDRWAPIARDALVALGFTVAERNAQPAALLGDQWALDDGAGGRVDLLRLESARLAERLGVRAKGDAAHGDSPRGDDTHEEAGSHGLFAEGRVGGRPVPCLSAAAQRALHSGFDARAVDRHDLRVLGGN